MAGPLRSERTLNAQFATREAPLPPPPYQHHQQLHPYASSPPNQHPFASFQEHNEPPAKRRKIILQGKQSTLDHHFTTAQSRPSAPPTNATVTQPPDDQVIETPNGVHITLDTPHINSAILNNNDNASLYQQAQAVPTVANTADNARPKRGQVDKRTLRSQDEGPRLKSELALYFPNYEDVMFDVQHDSDFITLDTSIYITEDPSKHGGTAQTSKTKTKAVPVPVEHSPIVSRPTSPNTQRSAPDQYNGSQTVSFEMIARTLPESPEDPLSDAHFFVSHRRAERKEKQLRNIERERAMHEKVQLERILDGLQGHDWLKALGITGVTDGEAKRYEAKRDHFIGEVQFLIDKFRRWKEEEKRQRLEREEARRDEESEEPETEAGSVEPPSSDLNASAARQLQQETANAIKSNTPKVKGKLTLLNTAPPPRSVMPPPPPSPEVPITSFYQKRHLRDTALGKSRHGRNVLAFGHPIPEIEARDFQLPREYVTEDTLRANARERRRRKRASLMDAT